MVQKCTWWHFHTAPQYTAKHCDFIRACCYLHVQTFFYLKNPPVHSFVYVELEILMLIRSCAYYINKKTGQAEFCFHQLSS